MKKYMSVLCLLSYGLYTLPSDSYLQRMMNANDRSQMLAGAQSQLTAEKEFITNTALNAIATIKNHDTTQAICNHAMTQQCFKQLREAGNFCTQGYQSLTPEQQTALKVVIGFNVAVIGARNIIDWIDHTKERNRKVNQGTQCNNVYDDIKRMQDLDKAALLIELA